jgi:hypothetical protein
MIHNGSRLMKCVHRTLIGIPGHAFDCKFFSVWRHLYTSKIDIFVINSKTVRDRWKVMMAFDGRAIDW